MIYFVNTLKRKKELIKNQTWSRGRCIKILSAATEKVKLKPGNKEQNNVICIYLQFAFINLISSFIFHVYLKLVSAIFLEIFIFSSNDSPSKTIKNVFYFI